MAACAHPLKLQGPGPASPVARSFFVVQRRRSAETLQASATVRHVRQIPGAGLLFSPCFCFLAGAGLPAFPLVPSSHGAGLLKPCRPVPLYALYGRFPAPVCAPSADSRQKPCRPAPAMSQACAKNLTDRHQQCHRPAPKTLQTGTRGCIALRQAPGRAEGGNAGRADNKNAIDPAFSGPKSAITSLTNRPSRHLECHFCTIIRFTVGNTDK